MNLGWSLSVNSRAECLTCPALILEKQFISNTAGRKCAIDIKIIDFFHLAEASLSAFSRLYTTVCGVAQKYHNISFIYNYSHF